MLEANKIKDFFSKKCSVFCFDDECFCEKGQDGCVVCVFFSSRQSEKADVAADSLVFHPQAAFARPWSKSVRSVSCLPPSGPHFFFFFLFFFLPRFFLQLGLCVLFVESVLALQFAVQRRC
jgi:hypothetical protein